MLSKLVLILNYGSSSLKFVTIGTVNSEEYLSGLVECFHLPEARIKWKVDDNKQEAALGAGIARSEALNFIVSTILTQRLKLPAQLTIVSHRIVHGDERYTNSVMIGESVIQDVKDVASFAPPHNPAYLVDIERVLKSFPQLKDKNVVVFDTVFHQTIPEESYFYALPYNLYEERGICRYDTYGTNHFYVTQETAKVLDRPVEELNTITCHLDNGGSVSAIRSGKCVNASIDLIPLEDLVIGTRSGDIGPTIILYPYDTLGMNVDAINKLLTRESGLLGLTEVANGCRHVEDNYTTKEGVERVIDVYCHHLIKYIGACTALMDGRLSAVVFTSGIGEDAAMIRELSLGELGVLGSEVDHERNPAAYSGESGFINREGTHPAVVIPTDEELAITQDASRLTA